MNPSKNISSFAFYCAILCMLGLFYGRAFLSIGTAAFALLALYRILRNPKLCKSSVPLIAIAMVLWLGLVSIFKENHGDDIVHEMSLRFGFLAILLGLWKQKFSDFQNAMLVMAFLLLSSSVALGTLINYLLNFSEINAQIAKSKPIPIITNYFHISFSYMLAISILTGTWYSLKATEKIKKWQKSLFKILTTVNFLLIHVIAARTGLVALYFAILALCVYHFALVRKEWLKTATVIFLSFVALISAVNLIPALQNRYKNTVKDFNVYLNDENPNWWSGTMRLESIENGIEIIKESPLTGVGVQNLSYAVDESFSKHGTLLLPENRINPHNQFINNAIEGGIPALLFLISLFVATFLIAFRDKNTLLMGFILASFIAFNLESFLERQFGACFFALILSWLASNARFSTK